MKRNTEKVVIEAEVPRTLTEVGVDAVDAAIKAAAPYLEHARDLGTQRVVEAQHRIAPLAEQAKVRVAPLTEQAKVRIAPIADQARARAGQAHEVLAPYVTDARTKLTEAEARIAPVAHQAKVRSAVGARGTLDNIAPRVEHALLAVGPLAEEAATRLHDDVVPKAAKFLDRAAGIEEPTSRRQRRKARKVAVRLDKAAAKVAKANAKALAREEKSGGGAWKVLLVLTGLIGLGLLVAKKLSTPKQDAWQNYQPTPPAAPTPQPAAAGEAVTEESATAEGGDDITGAEVAAAEAEADTEAQALREDESTTEGTDTEPTSTSAPEQTTAAAQTTAGTQTAASMTTGYGEGSYIGTQPPAEYPIKANPRSMKYHLPGSESFDRTISDVWFTTEEAAQAAGFTKATR